MATLDIFNNDYFSLGQLAAALDKEPYLPDTLARLGLFEPEPLRGTDIVLVEKRDNVLSLVPMSERGAPGNTRENEKRDIRPFQTRRMFEYDRLQASELFKIRAFGTESELQQVQSETMRRMVRTRRNFELTWESLRLGAVQGIVTFPTGSSGPTSQNWYTEWGINQPAEIDFALDEVDSSGNNTSDVRGKCHQVTRAMKRNAKGAWVVGRTRVHCLCGDTFYDQLINHTQVRRTFENWEAARALREDGAFQVFEYAGIAFENYQGTDDNSTVAISATEAKFFPVGAQGVFKVAWAPGETFADLGAPGMPVYPMIVPEARANPRWVDIELYSYPLFMCLRPEMLQRGKNT